MPWWLQPKQSQERSDSSGSGWASASARPPHGVDDSFEPSRDPREAARSLQERETQLRRMAVTVPGMLFDYILRPDGTDQFLYASPRATELLELEPEALMRDATLFWKMIDSGHLPRVTEEVVKANTARGRLHVEFPIVTPSGRHKWLQVRSDPEPEPPRHPAWIWSGVVLDVTDYRRALEEAERQRRMFQRLAENSPDVICRFDRALRLVYVNPAIERYTGLGPEEYMRSTSPEEPAPWSRSAEWSEVLRRALDLAQRGSAQVVFVSRSGREQHFEVTVVPELGPNGEVETAMSLAHDVTEQKRAEQSLREADRRKSEFLAVLSHELRNPLTPIKNSLYILKRTTAGSPQARRAQAVIDRQVGQLARLVDDLLDLTRIARDKIQLRRERLDLNHAVRQTVEDHRALLQRREIALELTRAPEPVYVDADPIRLAQIVANLVQNAAKFTAAGGRARVRVARDPPAGTAEIWVTDTGIGISSEVLSHLFQPFMQAERTLDRSKGGLGLGLALVKALAELHGGSVSAHSAGPDQGAEFVVRLPLAPTTAASDLVERRVRAGREARRRVLLIEDNIDAADSLREALELHAHSVSVAHRGPEGISKARREHPEVVLCDIGLPEMDGYEVARAFRSDAELRHTHLVALSGYAQPEDLRRAAEAGFEKHLAKPPDLEQIKELLETLPPEHSAREEGLLPG